MGVITEAQTGAGASWGHTARKWSGAGHSSLHALPCPPPLLSPLFLSPLQGGCVGLRGVLTSLVLSTLLQKSCTCHPGPPASPAASARSTPWPSCAPIFGQGPMPMPVASRSSSSPFQQRKLLQLLQHQAEGRGRDGDQKDPLQEAPRADLHTHLQEFHWS